MGRFERPRVACPANLKDDAIVASQTACVSASGHTRRVRRSRRTLEVGGRDVPWRVE